MASHMEPKMNMSAPAGCAVPFLPCAHALVNRQSERCITARNAHICYGATDCLAVEPFSYLSSFFKIPHRKES